MRSRPIVSAVLQDGSIVEMVYRPDERRTVLCVAANDTWRYERSLTVDGEKVVPYSPQNNLLTSGVVLFPSEPKEYEAEETLLLEIQSFIHRYVDVSPTFEKLASYYGLLTWVYDAFNELPYLRLRGDPGSGKTRFLLTVGSICYKPIFASGASTVSPLFRMLDAMRGTLLIDEADFRLSDERAEVVKILNNGNARGFPVLRSEVLRTGEINPRAYWVFGPKLVATRGPFQDRALESRCLTEQLGQMRLRDDVPITLPPEHKDEALHLRNKLLLFRFRSLHSCRYPDEVLDREIEPRLSQVFAPLFAIIRDPQVREEFRDLARAYDRDLIAERGVEVQAQVLEVIRDLWAATDGRVSVKDITSWFMDRYGEEYDRRITTRWVGSVIRTKLHLKTQKSHGVYVIPLTQGPALKRLYEKYGIAREKPTVPSGTTTPTPSVDFGDMGDVDSNNGTSAMSPN